ncbi:MAG: hypothetical protein JKY29_08685 [Gammaproteobacteria bacterium]|nr:hypothetical protein [Gammaproteobacteria bacterium]
MSEKKYADDDPERTLVTLDQLSQTIEVMTSVVNRLRRHLSDQIKTQLASQNQAQEELEALAAVQIESPVQAAISEPNTEIATAESPLICGEKNEQIREQGKESFVVEISQQETEPFRKSTKTLH